MRQNLFYEQKRKVCSVGGKETLCCGVCGVICDDFSRLEMLTLYAPAFYPQSVFVACDC